MLDSDMCGEERNLLQGSTVAVDDEGDKDSVSSTSSLVLINYKIYEIKYIYINALNYESNN